MRTCLVVAALVSVISWTAAEAARPYRGGVVATAHPYASEAALSILEKGGNATDAAVAAAFMLAVVGPYHSGVGGGGFALVHDAKSGTTDVIDFREVAPAKATRDMYVRDGKVVPGLSTDGALSVAVPGAVRGYLELHAKKGKLPRSVVLAPAIRAARQGFWVTPKYQAIASARLECLRRDPEASRLFLRKDAGGAWQVPPIGTVIKQPELANTLQQLAARGPSAFYEGRIAKAIARTVQEGGGILTEEDLKKYTVRWREPLEGSYRGHRILTMPPPSAGGLAIVQVLAALEKLEPQSPQWRDPQHVHRMAEAIRRVYVDRAKYLGDPAFVEIPMEKLVSDEAISKLAASIDPAQATPSVTLLDAGAAATQSTLPSHPGTQAVPSPEGAPKPKPDAGSTKNTTHISVIDRTGNALAMTTTVNYGFGSCLVAKGTGVLLNDEMDDFAAQPMVPNAYGLVTGEANAIAPGKVPLSSMSPTLVFQKDAPQKVMMAVGSPGGSTIPTTVLQVISNVIDHDMDIVRAVGAGRIHHQYMPDRLLVDRYGLEPATRNELRKKGHQLQDQTAWGDAEAVYVDPETGLRYAASDPRNEGAGVGQD
ncbi:MAG: gamma-glutamyltransferase [Myxococcaceae bacterium]